MKINKKLKSSLISSLILIASAISVVSCGSGDKNYKYFVNKLTNINLEQNNKDFNIKDYTSVSDFAYNNDPLTDRIYNVTDKNLSVNHLNFYNISNLRHSYFIKENNFTDLKYGGIVYYRGKIAFNLDGKIVPLDNILFSENFNLVVSKKNDYDNKVTFKNITLFFKIDDVGRENFSNLKFSNWKKSAEIDEFKIKDKTDFDIKGLKYEPYHPNDVFINYYKDLGLKKNSPTYTFWDDINWSTKWLGGWHTEQFSNITQLPELFVNSGNGFTVTNDEKEKDKIDFNFSANNIFASFIIYGDALPKPDPVGKKITIDAYFIGMFNKNNYQSFCKNSNFYVIFGDNNY